MTLSNLVDSLWDPSRILYTAAYLLAAFTAFQIIRLPFRRSPSDNIPWGWTYMGFLPRWVSGAIHSRYARQVMYGAHKRHIGRPFKVARHDVDLIVLPEASVNELASLQNAAASNILALQYDLVGQWIGLGTLNDGDLHSRVVHRRITPGLAQLTPPLQDEVANSIASFFPQQEDGWVEMKPYPVMMQIAARVFSRIVVGTEYCRDERWLSFAMNFTENVFDSIVFMRYFPPWMYPILHYMLPSVKRAVQNIQDAEELLVPVFEKLLASQDGAGEKWSGDFGAGNALGWLCELAGDGERNPKMMVHSQILLALGAIHTSLFTELNMLYDLMANPKNIDAIRREVADVSRSGWDYTSYSKLHKLDSMLRESQRLAPPFMIGLRRIMKQDYTFADGVTVHEGSYVCVLTPAVQNTFLDADEDPDKFYGLRSYDKRVEEGSLASTKYQFSTTDMSVLGFGQGRTACPGRFAASVTLKMIFVKLMTEYDFEFLPPGSGRPKSLLANEIISPDPEVKIRVRRRKEGGAPVF